LSFRVRDDCEEMIISILNNFMKYSKYHMGNVNFKKTLFQ
jgi:hypothetical protein